MDIQEEIEHDAHSALSESRGAVMPSKQTQCLIIGLFGLRVA